MVDFEQYKLKLTFASQKDVDKLLVNIKIEILTKHFTKLKSNPKIHSERLYGELKGFYSYHFGHHPEYRILFVVISDEVVILMIAKREN